jgi:hypothetical protein
LKHQEYYK